MSGYERPHPPRQPRIYLLPGLRRHQLTRSRPHHKQNTSSTELLVIKIAPQHRFIPQSISLQGERRGLCTSLLYYGLRCTAFGKQIGPLVSAVEPERNVSSKEDHLIYEM